MQWASLSEGCMLASWFSAWSNKQSGIATDLPLGQATGQSREQQYSSDMHLFSPGMQVCLVSHFMSTFCLIALTLCLLQIWILEGWTLSYDSIFVPPARIDNSHFAMLPMVCSGGFWYVLWLQGMYMVPYPTLGQWTSSSSSWSFTRYAPSFTSMRPCSICGRSCGVFKRSRF